MSEFHYYEFQTIGRTLTASQISEVKKLSRRAKVTPTGAVFTYSFGSFRGAPEQTLADYFDVMLHISNWSRQISFRLPAHLADLASLKIYERPRCVEIAQMKDSIIVTLYDSLDEEGERWDYVEEEECSHFLANLLLLRRDLLMGDYRSVYLAWIANRAGTDEDFHSLPVPANLRRLSKPLEALLHFFAVEPSSIAAWAQQRVDQERAPVELDLLSAEEMRAYLQRFLQGEACVDVELMRKLRSL